MSKGVKNDSQKIPLELIPPDALFEIGKVLKYGIEKYGRANWAQGIEVSRLIGAALRHISQFNNGEDFDEETKTLHIANAATNLMFAIWMMKNRPDCDDRWMKQLNKDLPIKVVADSNVPVNKVIVVNPNKTVAGTIDLLDGTTSNKKLEEMFENFLGGE